MEKRLLPIAIIVALVFFIGKSSIFTINEWERGLKFKFGEFSGEEIQPGLNFKIPVANTIRKYDIRIQTMDKQPERFLTINKEELLIDSFVKWKIKDLQEYFTSVNTKARAENRLQQKVNNSLKEQIAKRSIRQVVANDRTEIMQSVQQAVDEEAGLIGIEVVDVRLKRVDLADEIQGNVFARMRSERERIAKEKRAQGDEKAIQIVADADRQKQVILADAIREAQILRGDGDAQSTKIFADSFGQDEEFYELFRSLNAYKKTFESGNDLMVIDPKSDFFKFFQSNQ